MPEAASSAMLERLRRATSPDGSPDPPPCALVVVAHPDDEVIALGARLRRYRDAIFVHATDGAPLDGADARAHGFAMLDAYHAARHRELESAFALADIAARQMRQLGFSDQRAALALTALTESILQHLREVKPEVVLTHPYEGGHPDHDACAFAVHTAVALFTAEVRTPPLLIEATFYHQGPRGIETGVFLGPAPEPGVVEHWLSAEEQQRKQALLACFTTQRNTLQYFPTDAERFRIAPTYDFARPPHPGALFYEQFPWGMTGAHFCELAQAAQQHFAGKAAACR